MYELQLMVRIQIVMVHTQIVTTKLDHDFFFINELEFDLVTFIMCACNYNILYKNVALLTFNDIQIF